MNYRIKKWLTTFFILLSIGWNIIIYWLFLSALFNDFILIVNINHFGEAVLEIVLLTLLLPITIIGGYLTFRWIRDYTSKLEKQEILASWFREGNKIAEDSD